MDTRETREAALVASMSPKDKKEQVKASLEEIEATKAVLKRLGAGIGAEALKQAKRWVEFHRRLLKLMNHNKRIIVKFPKVVTVKE